MVINAADDHAGDAWRPSSSASRAARGGSRRVGALEEAHGGTLYIDEVADMPRETQNRILRVLVDQNFQRVGGTTRVHVDVRIISSSSRDLAEEIAGGRFREDLFHRLSVVPIRVPSLSERREDVPELISFFMDQISAATGLPRRRIAEDAMAVLQSHDWPGNVRQLRNNVERLMILTHGDPERRSPPTCCPPRSARWCPPTPNGAGGEKLMSLALREAREIFERDYLVAQISALLRQHLAHGRVHRHGALGPAPQAEVPGHRPAIRGSAGVIAAPDGVHPLHRDAICTCNCRPRFRAPVGASGGAGIRDRAIGCRLAGASAGQHKDK